MYYQNEKFHNFFIEVPHAALAVMYFKMTTSKV